MTNVEKIQRLESFKEDVLAYEHKHMSADLRQELRSKINQEKTWVRRQVIEAGCFHTLTLGVHPQRSAASL